MQVQIGDKIYNSYDNVIIIHMSELEMSVVDRLDRDKCIIYGCPSHVSVADMDKRVSEFEEKVIGVELSADTSESGKSGASNKERDDEDHINAT